MITIRRTAFGVLALALVAATAACGDTWEGAKKDTGDNLEATGEAIGSAGEAVKE